MSAEFWSMGGYAVYVWGSYGAGVAVFAWNWLAPRLARRDLRRRLRQAAGAEGGQAPDNVTRGQA